MARQIDFEGPHVCNACTWHSPYMVHMAPTSMNRCPSACPLLLVAPGMTLADLHAFIDYQVSFDLHCLYRFSGSWEREISPCWPDTPIVASCVSRPHFYRLSLPTITPAGSLTTTVCSRLGLPSLRMVLYHSTPPTPVLLQTVQEKPS